MVKVHPIRTEADYDAALARAEQLMDAEEDTIEADELDVLATLIEAYEDEHYPMGREADAVDAIKFRMEQQGLTRKDLEPLIGGRMRVAEVLSRKRDLTLAMIRRLHAELGIPADMLVRPTRAVRQRQRRSTSALRRARSPAGAATD
jgi:HTH-type transcriptional regulator/antitoxin HigA